MIKGKAGGFFTPQEEGGKCKLTILFEDREAQDAAFLLRYQDVRIERDNGEQAQVQGPEDAVLSSIEDRLERLLAEIRAIRHSGCNHKLEPVNAGPAIEAARGAFPDFEEDTE